MSHSHGEHHIEEYIRQNGYTCIDEEDGYAIYRKDNEDVFIIYRKDNEDVFIKIIEHNDGL